MKKTIILFLIILLSNLVFASHGTYDEITQKCIYFPEEETICENPYTYDGGRDRCVAFPIKEINCPINTAYDSFLDKCIGTREVIINNNTIILKNESYLTQSAQEACRQSGGSWDTKKRICILNAPQVYSCPSGSTERITGNQKICVSNLPLSQTGTESSGEIPSIPLWIWAVIIFLFAYFVFEVGPNRGFFRRKL